MYRLKEQKRSRCFDRTLLIKDFKYRSSLSILVGKNKEAQLMVANQSIFHHDNNTIAEFDSGPKYRLVRGNRGPKYPYRACFVIF